MKWGEFGSADWQFAKPSGITTDKLGFVYVVDGGNYRILKFNSNGKYIQNLELLALVMGSLYIPVALR